MSSHFNTSYNLPLPQTPFADQYSDGRTSTSALHLGTDGLSDHSFHLPQVLSTSGESMGEGDSLSHEFLDSLGLPSIRSRYVTVSLPLSHHPS